MIVVAVNDVSQVGEARREANRIAKQIGFDENAAGRVALVVTELGTNIVKHGGGGEMLIGAYEDDVGNGIEILALDRGPGMASIQTCIEDGYSSAGTKGNGLGAVLRQAQFVDIASWPNTGTAVLARIEPVARKATRDSSASSWGAVSIAMPGEVVCGDSWTTFSQGGIGTLFVADGLGHGQDAAEASVAAVRLFHRFSGHQLSTLLDYVHGGLRSTRGAAVSVARFDPALAKVVFAGIGNVAGALASNGQVKRMVTMPGTAGYNVRKIQSFEYPFDGGLVILHSDGLSASWTLARYPNLQAFHPTLIAAILYRDFARHRDDATVLVGKWTSGR